MTNTYKKNPVQIQAVQFTEKNKDQVYHWCKSIQQNVWHCFDDNNSPALMIPTLEGEMQCQIGDFLIVEPFPTDHRRLYPCKPEIFNQTYSLIQPNN